MRNIIIILLITILTGCSTDDYSENNCNCRLKTTTTFQIVNIFGETVTTSVTEYSEYGTRCSSDGVITEDEGNVFSIVECE